MEKDIRIKPGDHVIQNNPQPPRHPSVDSPCRNRLYYIENPEKKESSRHSGKGTGKEGHRDQVAYHFINDDFRAVPLAQNDFGPLGDPTSQSEKGRRAQ